MYKELIEKCLLTDEERSETIQSDTTLWCPTKGKFLDEVGAVIAKAQIIKAYPIIAEEIKRELEKSMALERCDPDVMPYFTDYYWLPKDVWQDYWGSIV